MKRIFTRTDAHTKGHTGGGHIHMEGAYTRRDIHTEGHKGGRDGFILIGKLTFLVLHDNQLKSTPPEGG